MSVRWGWGSDRCNRAGDLVSLLDFPGPPRRATAQATREDMVGRTLPYAMDVRWEDPADCPAWVIDD